MKEAPLLSPSPERAENSGLSLSHMSFLGNGPYSVNVKPGECIGLTGTSGIGKTQLLRAIADVIVHGGNCSLDGEPCSSFSPPVWRKMVAMIPAESFWWHDTVGAHFEDTSQRPEFLNLIEKLGFSSDIVGWQISRLSTGERQRLSLIRTLIQRPRVLLLDEPTSALDIKMVMIVEEILAAICDSLQISCLWVSHDIEQLFRVAGKVYRVEKTGFTKESDA